MICSANSPESDNGIVIVGSGFAAYQLVKMLRKQSAETAITVVTSGNGDDYTKPELSHVFSRNRSADELIKTTGEDFAREHNIRLLSHTTVSNISPADKTLSAGHETLAYNQLVLATGGQPFIPAVQGDAADEIITLNSLDEYRAGQERLSSAKRVLVIGGGLVGTEIAMDLAVSGRDVVLTDREPALMPRMLPSFISARLLQALAGQRCQLELETEIDSINRTDAGLKVLFKNGRSHSVDCVVAAAGLRPNTQLATQAGLKTNRGICVNASLQTSDASIYALGDCAEINGQILPFLQPIILSAGSLARVLLGEAVTLNLPAMLVNIKTPLFPVQFSGSTADDSLEWKVDINSKGTVARSYTPDQKLAGFVTTETRLPESFPLLRQLA